MTSTTHSDTIRSFEIEIPDEEIDDLRFRLASPAGRPSPMEPAGYAASLSTISRGWPSTGVTGSTGGRPKPT